MAKLNSKNRISVDLKEEDRKALQELADSSGQTISQIVRASISDRLALMRRMQASVDARGAAVNAAFQALDAQDVSDGLALPITPPVAQVKPPYDPKRHPCAHLNPNFIPPNYRVGEIPGTCTKQGMKPCHYTSAGASSCPLFVRASFARR
jgi:predicted transcriptional regulator